MWVFGIIYREVRKNVGCLRDSHHHLYRTRLLKDFIVAISSILKLSGPGQINVGTPCDSF